MSYKSGFFDAVDQGSGDYDRVYNASDFAEYFSRFVGNGVFASPANGLTVESAGGMSLAIKPGYAWINGYLFSVISGTTEVLTVPVANPTMNRYDSVVLGLDYQNRQITPYIKSGSPAASPSAASLTRSSSLYEIEIARVYVATGASYVSQANITDTRSDKTRCGFVTGLIDQIDASDLFSQFEAAFNEWFEDLQDTLDDDVAANLLARIQATEGDIQDIQDDIQGLTSTTNQMGVDITSLKDEVSVMSKFYNTQYTGQGLASKSITVPFSPRRVKITQIASVSVSGVTTYSKDDLEIISSDGSTYKGVFTRVTSGNAHECRILTINKSVSNGQTTLSWSSSSSTYACGELGEIYYVTAWGV